MVCTSKGLSPVTDSLKKKNRLGVLPSIHKVLDLIPSAGTGSGAEKGKISKLTVDSIEVEQDN